AVGLPAARRGTFRAGSPETVGRAIVLFLSRIDEKKGLDLLLAAFQRIRASRPEALLVIAGEGPATLVLQLKTDAARLGIAADVLWTGFVEGAAKDALLADADLFVLPSYSENFGIAVAEAMAAGLPVVVSDQVAVHTDVTRAGAGVVVACDVSALAGAVEQLLSDPPTRTEMGRNGRAFVSEHYSPAAV